MQEIKKECPNCGGKDFYMTSRTNVFFDLKDGKLEYYDEENLGLSGNVICHICEEAYSVKQFKEFKLTK
jgi:hypothetical protein